MKLPFRRNPGQPDELIGTNTVLRLPKLKPSRKAMAVTALCVFAAGLGGLGWGLAWLMSDLPRHDRPWEPHEALADATKFMDENHRTLASRDREELSALASADENIDLPAIGEGPINAGTKQPMDDSPSSASREAEANDSTGSIASAPAARAATEQTGQVAAPIAPAVAATALAPKKDVVASKATPQRPAQTAFEELEEGARQFIRSYLSTAERHIPSREAAYYADQVSYFKHGRVSRRFVEADQRNYYRRWPKRDYTLLSAPEVLEIGPSDMLVQFRINYAVSNGDRIARGVTRNRVRLKQTDSTFQITSIQEQHER